MDLRIGQSSTPIIICVTIVMHLTWCVGLMIEPSVIQATALHTLLRATGSPQIAAGVYGGVAVLAIGGLLSPCRSVRVCLILPQQIVLYLFSVSGVTYAMSLGQFADGTFRTHWFLIVDQIPIVLIAFGHSAAMFLIADKHGHA